MGWRGWGVRSDLNGAVKPLPIYDAQITGEIPMRRTGYIVENQIRFDTVSTGPVSLGGAL